MSALRPIARLSGLAATSLLVGTAFGQATPILTPQTPNPTPVKPNSALPTVGGINFQTSVGSFKLLGPGDDPARGKLTFSFEGTVLVSGATKTTKLGTSGNIRRELVDAKRNKQVYHGTGTMTIDGPVKAVQFFGRNVKARYFGTGIFRLYGEFDKKLETGFYQYDGSPERRPWGTGGMTVVVPSPEQATPKPKIRINPKGG